MHKKLLLLHSRHAALSLSQGISIRFPRLVRKRDDKQPEQATSADQVRVLPLSLHFFPSLVVLSPYPSHSRVSTTVTLRVCAVQRYMLKERQCDNECGKLAALLVPHNADRPCAGSACRVLITVLSHRRWWRCTKRKPASHSRAAKRRLQMTTIERSLRIWRATSSAAVEKLGIHVLCKDDVNVLVSGLAPSQGLPSPFTPC